MSKILKQKNKKVYFTPYLKKTRSSILINNFNLRKKITALENDKVSNIEEIAKLKVCVQNLEEKIRKKQKSLDEIKYQLTEVAPDFDEDIKDRANDIFQDYQNGYFSKSDSDDEESDKDEEIDYEKCKLKATQEYISSDEFKDKCVTSVLNMLDIKL